MIRHLATNGTQNLNPSPTKVVVLSHYTQHMILSQSNLDCNKHFQVEFCAYVQAPQVNDPNNTNHPRTLDGIYLCPCLISGWKSDYGPAGGTID